MPRPYAESHLRRGLLRPNRPLPKRCGWLETTRWLSDLLKLFWECPTTPPRAWPKGHDHRQPVPLGDRDPAKRRPGSTSPKASARHYQGQLTAAGFWRITRRSWRIAPSSLPKPNHQQYLARPGSRPYCSARAQRVRLTPFRRQCLSSGAERSGEQYGTGRCQHCVCAALNTPRSASE